MKLVFHWLQIYVLCGCYGAVIYALGTITERGGAVRLFVYVAATVAFAKTLNPPEVKA